MPTCSKMYIDLPFLIFVFAVMFGDSITTNWIIFRTCYVTLGYNRSECALLGSSHQDNSTAKLEQLVEPHATIIIMTKSLMGVFGAPIICFFLGPWSDMYGRKPVLLLTIGGVVFQHLILATICEIPNISPWFILLSVLPSYICGGFTALLSAVLCYINDTTPSDNRGVRIAIFYATLTLGFVLASLASPHALRILGYFVMYLTAASLVALSWLLIFLFIKESVQNPETDGKYKNLFQLSLVKETVQTTFKRRDSYKRLILITILIFLIMFVLADSSSSNIFLYVREKFHWSLETYTTFRSINVITGTLGGLVGIYVFHKLLHINESIIITFGFISVISAFILYGLATKNWQIYLAGALGCLYGTISPMSRSLLSKTVPSDEYGKIFSFLAVCESIVDSLGSLLCTYVYNRTLSTFPGAFLLIAASIHLVGMSVSIVLIMVQRIVKNQNQHQLLIPQE